MCNLYANTMPPEAARRLFEVAPEHDATGNAAPEPAIFPRGTAPVVAVGKAGQRALRPMHWGFLLPQTSKRTGEAILPKAVNNARDDKVRSSPFWKASFERRRCLVPATSFCEPKGRRPADYHWFALTGDTARPPFAFAGLWRLWSGVYRGEEVRLETYTIVTTRPNALVAPVHPDRMPVILDPSDWETWLHGEPEAAADLMRPFPAEVMRIVRTGTDAKSDPLPEPGGVAHGE